MLRATAVAAHTAAARRQRFARRNQPPTPLVKERRDRVKARLDGGDINHPVNISIKTNRGNLYRDSIVAFFTNLLILFNRFACFVPVT